MGRKAKILPDKINIMGHVFTVEECDRVINDEPQMLWGEISYTKRLIRITTKHPCPDPRSVLIHEIIHGVCDEGGIELDESNVRRLANNLTDTLERNGLLK